jgi:hypothetical protein
MHIILLLLAVYKSRVLCIQMNDVCRSQTLFDVVLRPSQGEAQGFYMFLKKGFDWVLLVPSAEQRDSFVSFSLKRKLQSFFSLHPVQQIMEGAVQRRVDWVSLRKSRRWVTLMSTAPNPPRLRSVRSEIHPL